MGAMWRQTASRSSTSSLAMENVRNLRQVFASPVPIRRDRVADVPDERQLQRSARHGGVRAARMQEPILSWLRQILAERFGHRFLLRDDGNGYVSLGIADDPRVIEIASTPGQFIDGDGGSDLCHGTWDAALEGWQPAIAGVLPAPGLAGVSGPLIERTAGGYRVHYDILGFAYWMLTRQEEVGRSDLDEHGRFPATASHAFRHGYLERPVVDEWLHVLGQVMGRLWPTLPLARHHYRLCVSHDVDMPSRYGFVRAKTMLRRMAADVLKHRDFHSALTAPRFWRGTRSTLHPDDPANTFDWIMSLSEFQGISSAFYFICGRTHPDRDADYEPEHPAIRHLMRRIHLRGHEIGLHPSYNTYLAPASLQREATRLKRVCAEEGIEQPAWGGRMHFLRWEQPTTLRYWEDAGMDYDSTLGYADRPGFRCGTCFEYPAFDPVARHALKIRVRPLIAMECTIIAQRYMNLGLGDTARAKFTELVGRCKAVNGTFTLLWHNAELCTPAHRALYRDVLAQF
ncbi:hypothetical protein LMG26411_02122 [Cupriavidus numazuensis]|uniref:DUF7033 domain-containing protein n=2 Tax=Cupriavidus numazuensis TaxID=221992 RepID=A0ABN7PY03_9BURK|nr:hypothetical protein LMG26411_02122 [Cupriavidus numazuensis]